MCPDLAGEGLRSMAAFEAPVFGERPHTRL